ncbi:MAG: hypothetical protein CL678_08555 [Bdellovibrionaceae bacterium]|nr:hypothetical protein [Pseudobdellovibrionaceae bacterium]
MAKSDNATIEELRYAWQQCLHGKNGEKVKRDLGYYIQRSTHVPGDSHTSAFNAGQQALAQAILSLAEEKDD